MRQLRYAGHRRPVPTRGFRFFDPSNSLFTPMGRRALRGIDPALDLAPYLKSFDDLHDAWTPSEWFCRNAPLELEVGSGKGLFLATASVEKPSHDFLGIEISRKYARFSAARLAKTKRSNASILHGDAQQLIARYILPDSLTAAHVYFPDPWWKKRHRRRRVMNEPFLVNIERTLIPGGRLHFWTDVKEYFQESLALLKQVTGLQGPLEVPLRPAEHDLDYRTHYERRTRLQDEPVFRAEFMKNETDPARSMAS